MPIPSLVHGPTGFAAYRSVITDRTKYGRTGRPEASEVALVHLWCSGVQYLY